MYKSCSSSTNQEKKKRKKHTGIKVLINGLFWLLQDITGPAKKRL